MDTNDRRLIDDLAQEIAKAQPVTKDAEAEQLIAQRIAAQPDAVYLLTQAVLLQQEGLRQAQAQVQNLQAQLQNLQAQQRRQQSGGGGLFSGLFGGGGFGQPQAPQYASPQYAPQQPYYAQRGSSSFLAQAASSAVGIAGGLFLFEGISNLFGGDGFGGGQEQAFEQGYDQGYDSGFDQGQDQGDQGAGADQGQGFNDQSGFDQAGFDQAGFDQSGWDNSGDFDGGGDWGV
ncbi:hypothetical protein GCM10022286_19640 [Gryllotalpicola daejeonensis]|uniref:DUF2076 domain-containing protein n=1 Tax=Gryllotalpicola daejeonensis TaxID=993087 RepID=A0ABP7ZKJ4_9MICO